MTIRLLLVTALLGCSLAGPTNKHASSKEKEHIQPDLSGQEHYNPQREHNSQYDHEAFLGEDQAHEFDTLTPAESRRRLGVIADKVDTNNDGVITKEELMVWITHISRRFVLDDVEKQWPSIDTDGDDHVTWKEYHNKTFGMLKPEKMAELYDTHRQLTFEDVIKRDEQRFKVADLNKDMKLTKDEFGDFIHPEDVPHMRDIVIEETMNDMDKNRDGLVSVEEYINDLWPESERKENPKEPSWVQAEREQFKGQRDKDKDGLLNKEELGKWIIPQDYDPIEAEASHLIYEADSNKDKQLSKGEMMEHYEVFVGSQATNYGDYMRQHNEFK